jgi:hypothetical protein
VSTVAAHIPWLFTYLRLIPGAATVRLRMFDLAAEYVNKRVSEGSNVKDLIYHLVSKLVLCLLLTPNFILTEL